MEKPPGPETMLGGRGKESEDRKQQDVENEPEKDEEEKKDR